MKGNSIAVVQFACLGAMVCALGYQNFRMDKAQSGLRTNVVRINEREFPPPSGSRVVFAAMPVAPVNRISVQDDEGHDIEAEIAVANDVVEWSPPWTIVDSKEQCGVAYPDCRAFSAISGAVKNHQYRCVSFVTGAENQAITRWRIELHGLRTVASFAASQAEAQRLRDAAREIVLTILGSDDADDLAVEC